MIFGSQHCKSACTILHNLSPLSSTKTTNTGMQDDASVLSPAASSWCSYSHVGLQCARWTSIAVDRCFAEKRSVPALAQWENVLNNIQTWPTLNLLRSDLVTSIRFGLLCYTMFTEFGNPQLSERQSNTRVLSRISIFTASDHGSETCLMWPVWLQWSRAKVRVSGNKLRTKMDVGFGGPIDSCTERLWRLWRYKKNTKSTKTY